MHLPRIDWVSVGMLWDALRWVVLKEQEDEREKRMEEKRLRRLQILFLLS